MTKENMDQSRKRRYEAQSDRNETSHSHKVASRKSHHKDESQQRHNRQEKTCLPHNSDQHDRRNRHEKESANRREWRRRNSPIELVPRRQSTDNSSSTEEVEDKRHESRRHGGGNTRKREHEESFEELSRRKRRIESELNALDAEEAAAREDGRKQRNHARNHPEPKRNEHTSTHHREGRNSRTKGPERIKEEPVRIKNEPTSDEEPHRRKTRPVDAHRQKPSNHHQQQSDGEWGQASEAPAKPKEKPNFKTSGKLAEDTNTYNGVVIKYNEPSEARRPKRKWRLYPFKGTSDLPFIPVHRQSAYLLGRTRTIADIPIDHPSCSKQHAVLQFRATSYKREDGSSGRQVRPYIIDLESANGTFVNNKKVDPRCYVELLERDVLKFGFSTREYVILHEDSKHEVDDVDSN